MTGDQHIMSPDGKPVATITPGVAIYVTTLLEFVGEKILQDVSRVIERDNSDEASVRDLYAAITEEEMLHHLFRTLEVRHDFARSLSTTAAGRSRMPTVGDDSVSAIFNSTSGDSGRTARPWQVPSSAMDYDQAAAGSRSGFGKRLSRTDLFISTAAGADRPIGGAISPGPGSSSYAESGRASSMSQYTPSMGHESRDGGMSPAFGSVNTMTTLPSGSSIGGSAAGHPFQPDSVLSENGLSSHSKRASTDVKSGFASGLFQGVRRRGSFKKDREAGVAPQQDPLIARQAFLEKDGRANVPDISVNTDPDDVSWFAFTYLTSAEI